MRSVSIPVAALIAIVSLVLGGFLARTIQRGAPAAASVGDPRSPFEVIVPPIPGPLATSILESPRQLVQMPAATLTTDHEPTTTRAAEVGGGDRDSPTEMEAKYAGKDLEHLMIALQGVMAIHGGERERLIGERWDLGLYDETFVAEGAQQPKLPSPRASDGSFPSYGFKTLAAPGGMIVRTTVLQPEEYPEFAAIERELKWLRARTGRFPQPSSEEK